MRYPVDVLRYLLLAIVMYVPSFVYAETAPFTTTTDKISAGDTAWMLMATALVMLMTIPGLALFYAG
ncbi:MAG TPA: hypothetical protein PLJ88_10995, partial [Agitococcus sp.]|nr:hypothetical protein [Agitococcus sp.]